MIDLSKLPIIQKSSTGPQPKHVLINLFPLNSPEDRIKDDFKKLLNLMEQLMEFQREKNLPIMTISLGKDIPDSRAFMFWIDDVLLPKASERKINVTFFGRWYDLKGETVTAIKKVTAETKNYDHFFLNVCVNYDGQREIADACRVIIRKVLQEKADIDSINPEMLKENIYSSYFLPVDLIVEPTGKFSGTFLWDSVNAKIHLLNKKVAEISKQDIVKAYDIAQ